MMFEVRDGVLPKSIGVISSCLKAVTSSASSVVSTVRSAREIVSGSISSAAEKENRVLHASFDKIQTSHTSFKHVLLLSYCDGFQVLDVNDSSNIHGLISEQSGPVTALHMLPLPDYSEKSEEIRASHPLLVVLAGEETNPSPIAVRFYSLKTKSCAHILRFRSPVYLVQCSTRVVAVALSSQIYCFDALTLESKFSVATYPMQNQGGRSMGIGPLDVGPRWLAYVSGPNNPIKLPSRSINEALSKYCQEFLPELSDLSKYVSFKASVKNEGNHAVVVVKDVVSKKVVSQFKAHSGPISALCFDPSGTILVTASLHGSNLNVFRIFPNQETSHVHLYKLYRGLTPAVIQNISFSHLSQWVAVVSSHGTCHVYMMSPSSLSNIPPVLSLSKPKGMDQDLVTLSAIFRIKDAMAALFHRSVYSNPDASEHVMVCSSSGRLVQHDLMVSWDGEELRSKAVSIQRSQVCQRYDDHDDGNNDDDAVIIDACGTDVGRSRDRSYWYVSNAEVSTSSGRMLTWLKHKVRFFCMDWGSVEGLEKCSDGGEMEIERVSIDEVEIKRKDLIPVFGGQRFYPATRSSNGDKSPIVINQLSIGDQDDRTPNTT